MPARELPRRSRRLRHKRTIFPVLESLELRATPAVFNVVPATADGATGSLRDAINQSDSNGDAENTINLAAGTYGLTDQVAGNLQISDQAAGVAAKTFTIVGSSISNTIIDASQLGDRVFQINSAQGAAVTVIFENLTIENGKAHDPGAAAGSGDLGGGILIDGGTVTMSSVAVKSNAAGMAATSSASKTAAQGGNGTSGAAARGGGVYLAAGSLTLNNVTVSGNRAYGGKGGSGGPGIPAASATGSAGKAGGDGGSGGAADGGGLFIAGGAAVLAGDTISGNRAVAGRGGAGGDGGPGLNGGNGGAGGSAAGGAVGLAAGNLTVRTSVLSSNSARGGAGGAAGAGGFGLSGQSGVAGLSGVGTGTKANGDPGSKGANGQAGGAGGAGGQGGTASGGGLYIGSGTVTLDQDQFQQDGASGGSGGEGGAGGTGGTGGRGGRGGTGAIGKSGGDGASLPGDNGGRGGAGGAGGTGGIAGRAGAGGAGGNGAGGAVYLAAGTLSIDSTTSDSDAALGGIGGTGGRDGRGGAGGVGGIGGGGGAGGGGGQATKGGHPSIPGGSGGRGGVGGLGGAGGLGGPASNGGAGGAGGSGLGGGVFVGQGTVRLALSSDTFHSNEAKGGRAGPGGLGGTGGAAAIGGLGGSGGAGGYGGAGAGGLTGGAAAKINGFDGGSGGTGGNGGAGGQAGTGGTAGVGGQGGLGGSGAGGGLFVSGGTDTISGSTFLTDQVIGGTGGAGGQGGQGGDVPFGGSGGFGGAGGGGGTAGAPGKTSAGAVVGRGGHGGLGGLGGRGGNAGSAGVAHAGSVGGNGGIGGSASGGAVYLAAGTVTIGDSTLQGDSAAAGAGGAGGQGGAGGSGVQNAQITNRSYGVGRGGYGGRGGTGGIAGHITLSHSGNQSVYAGTGGRGGVGGKDGDGGSGAAGAAGGPGGAAGRGGAAEGGALYVASGTLTLSADTLSSGTATGGAGGAAGHGGPGGNGGVGGRGGPVLASHSGAIPSFSYNHGGSGGPVAPLPTGAHLAAGASGQGGAGGQGGNGGNGGDGGTGGAGGQAGNGGTAGGGGFYIAGGSITALNDTFAGNAVAPAAAGAAGSGGQAGAAGSGGSAGQGGAGGLADLGNGPAAAAGPAGAAGGIGIGGRPGAAAHAGSAGAATGGGVEIATGRATFDNSTIALNTHGGGVAQSGGSVTTMSTLFAGNGAVDYSGSVTASNCLFQTAPTGSVTGSNNLTGVDPKLDTAGLANNGGPTETIALQASSPAIGAGANPENLFTDQRGDAPRTGSGGTDIGAFQFGAVADSLAPTASLQATTVNANNAAGLSPYKFTIVYSDNVAITPGSLAGSIVKVVPPGAGTPITATLDSITPMGSTDPWGDAQTFDVTYQITPPGGSWSETDDGTYSVTAAGTLPSDLAGNTLSPGAVGSFQVQVFTGLLDVTVEPQGPFAAGSPFSFTVEAKDAGGNLIGNFDEDVTLTLEGPSGSGSVSGTMSQAAVGGVAAFSGVMVDQAGTGYTIQAAAIGLTSTTTTMFDVNASTVSKLIVKAEPPMSIAADTGFPLTVEAEDTYNNLVMSYSGAITVGIQTGPSGAALGGLATTNAQSGVANFSGLTLDTAGSYVLQATATGASLAQTTMINVSPPAVVNFDSADFTSKLTAGSASVQVDRSANLGATVSVMVSSPGVPNVVAAFSRLVSFGPNVTSELVAIPITNDGLAGNSPADVSLSLSSPGAGTILGAPVSSTLVIDDDNPRAVIQLASAQVSANVTDGSANIVLTRGSDLGATVSVVFSSPGGPDVAAFSETVAFGPNVTSQAVKVPINNDGVFGESEVNITLELASPSLGASLGTVAMGTLVIHDDNPKPPPPLPLVTIARVVDKTNKKHQVTEVDVDFSGPLNATQADSTTLYRLATPGKHNSYTAKNAVIIRLKSATYASNGGINSVALIPKKPFLLTKSVQLVIDGLFPNGLEDAYGRLIDGDGNGTAGGNAVVIISKKTVTVNGVPSARASGLTANSTIAAVDALLARSELAGLRESAYAQRAGRHTKK